MYGRSMYGGSMYGGMGGMYGSSMYGGGMGGMYGSSMYGRSMYGGGMGGQYNRGNSEFFGPKEQVGDTPSRLREIKDLNNSFLDFLHSGGDTIVGFVKKLLAGLARLHAALVSGKVSPAVARQAAVLAMAAAAFCFAGAARMAVRQRRTASWEALFKRLGGQHALPWSGAHLAAAALAPRAAL